MHRHFTIAARFAALLLVVVLILTACADTSSANKSETQATDNQFGIYTTSQPIHTYNFSMPRDVMLQIYDATMTAHNTWTVWYALDHTPLDMCPSVGYPIPGGTQLTNPVRPVYSGDTGIATVAQGEPNGLYPPSTASGTWVLCVHGGQTEPTYVEPNVVTYSHPVKIENGQVVDAGGASSVTVQVRNATQTTAPAPTAPPKP